MKVSKEIEDRILELAGRTPRVRMKRPASLSAPSLEGVLPLRTVSEADFQKQVTIFAHLHGWKVASFRTVRVQRKDGSTFYETPAGADGAGWFDLVLVHRKRRMVIAVELKIGKNKKTDAQLDWALCFEAAGVPVYTWKPKDWPEIERVLGT